MNVSTRRIGAAAALLVTLALLTGIDPQDPPTLVRLAGRLHPLIVHFPIGLLLLALFLRLLDREPPRSLNLGDSADLVWDLGALSAIAVALTGNALSLEGGFDPHQTGSLRVLDVSDPAAPRELGSHQTLEAALKVQVQGSLA